MEIAGYVLLTVRRLVRPTVGLLACLALVASLALMQPRTAFAVNPNLKHFGFALVDTMGDDPHDGLATTNYIDEVGYFTNMNHLWVYDPAVSIASRLDTFTTYESKALVDVKDIFLTCSAFVGGTGSGTKCKLRGNYKSRWNQFVSVSNIAAHLSQIASFYIADEPAWLNVNAWNLATIANRVNASFPSTPISYVEAYQMLEDPSLNHLVIIPRNVDWVGFDRYGTFDPQTDPAYLNDLAVLKSKRTAAQKIVMVFEAHYIDPYYAPYITQEDMKQMFLNYYGLASSDMDHVAMIGWHWPDGDDPLTGNDDFSARNLPLVVKNQYVQTGQTFPAY